ncbi:MAG: tyrosine-type recombinase/integrase [bacterium]
MRLKDVKKRAEAVYEKVRTADVNLAQELVKIENEIQATTVLNGWQAYLEQHNRPDTGETTLTVYEGQYETFARWLQVKYPKVLELRHVTQEHADAYAGHLLKKISASTFNRHMNLLALVWRVLEKTARLSCNPWKTIGRKRFAVHSRRELTVEELCRVCEAAQGEMRLLLALGIYCGLRLGDAACLDWSNVDMVKGFITLVPMKTARRSQKRITLPIHRTLFSMLAETPVTRRKGFVMPDTAARYGSFDGALAKDVAKLFNSVDIKTGANAMTKSEKDAEAEAKEKTKAEGKELPPVKTSGKAKRASADCGFHSLRHTFVSLCAAGGVPQSVVQSLVGHGSPAMTAHYTHIGIETAQNAVALLPDVTRAKGLAEVANATEAEIEALQKTLDHMTLAQLQAHAAKVKALIGTLKTVGKTKAV